MMDVSYHITQYTNIINDLREEIRRLQKRLDNANSGHHGDHRDKDDSGQLSSLKDSLVSIFRHQMELR